MTASRAPRAINATPATNAVQTIRQRTPRLVDAGDERSAADLMTEQMTIALAQNTIKNTASRAEKAATDELLKIMVRNSVQSHRVEIDGKVQEAKIEKPKTITIDVQKLFAEVDEATFLKIVTATQTNVKKEGGSVMLAKVSKETVGDNKVGIKEIKGAPTSH
jgi:hypothetical protein